MSFWSALKEFVEVLKYPFEMNKAAKEYVIGLGDPQPMVRRLSVQGLEIVGNPRYMGRLLIALLDDDEGVRDAAHRALDKIDVHWPDSKAAVRFRATLDALLGTKDAKAARAAEVVRIMKIHHDVYHEDRAR